MIKAIIFDLGGVIQGLDWSPVVNAIIDLKEGLDIETYKAALYYDRENYFDLYETSQMSKEQFWGMVATRLNIDQKHISKLSESFELLYSFVNYELIDFLRKLKQDYKLFALANISPELENKIVKDNIYAHLFDSIYYSHQIGLKKPDPKAFYKVLEENDMIVEECLFVDNDMKNIVGANNIGIKSVLYVSVDLLKKEICKHLTADNNNNKDKIVVGYATGVFDLFHQGHLNLLKNAKKHCDKLIVGLTTDELAFNFKGKKPVIPLEERMAIVEAIKYVDKVVSQTNMDKFAAWEEHHFDVMVASTQPTGKWPLVQAEFLQKFKDRNLNPPKIVNLPYAPRVSTTIRREVLTQNGIITEKNENNPYKNWNNLL
jgi:glycerol-3-phosphate cytidylyltransferase